MAGWLTGWKYRKSHEIIGSSAGAVSDYQIKIKVHYGSGTDSGEDVYLNGKCRNDFGDIRFTDSDGETELPYWMEKKVDGDYAIFWVKVPYIPAPRPKVETGTWIVDGYTYHRRTKITITENSGNDLTDYQIKVVINTKWLVDNGYATPNGNEVRFTDSDGSTLLSFWRETDFNTEETVYWVKIPSLPANSTKTIYIYYDEELTTVPDASNGESTFEFFDDFESYTEGQNLIGVDGYSQKNTPWDTGSYFKAETIEDTRAGHLHVVGTSYNEYVKVQLMSMNKFSFSYKFRLSNVTSDSFYMGLYDADDNLIAILRVYAGKLEYYNGSAYVSLASVSANVWYKIEFRAKSPSEIDLYVNDAFKAEVGIGSNPLDYLSWGAWKRWTGDAYIDNIMLRKYTDPEPSVEVEGSKATIYIYYGNPDATTTSNGANTFIDFDDFESYIEGQNLIGVDGYSQGNTPWDTGSYFHADSLDGNRRGHLHSVGTTYSEYVKIELSNPPTPSFRLQFLTYLTNVASDAFYISFWDSDDVRMASLRFYNGYLQWYDGSVYHNIMPVSAKTWYKIRLDATDPSNIKLYVNDEYKLEIGIGSRTAILDYMIWGNYRMWTGDAYIDNRFLAKYVDPEPSHGVWGSEESCIVHMVSITDVGKASDSLRKTSIKKLVDTSKGLDYFSRTVSFHLDIVDIGEVEDYVSKQPKIIISDYSSISDYLNRGFLRALRDYASLCEYINFGYYVSLIDRVFGDFDFTTIRGKVLREVVKGIDRIVKKPTVMLIDSAEAFDYIQSSASFHVTLTDAGKLLDYISKIASRYIVLTDSSKLIDLISKIPSINIRDSSSVYDVTRKSTVRLLRDLSSVGDYISKSLSKMLMDRVYGDFDFRKISVYVRELADSSKVADWHVKETVKYMVETITSIDYLSKNIGKKIVDATTSLDYISTIGAFHVTLHDAGRTADKILKEYGKNLADSITASDYVLKNITHVILDAVKSIDFTSSSITLILRDSVFGDFYASRLLGKEITDAVKAVDVRAVWDLAKILREYVTVRDSPYRTVIITLIDRVFHDIETSKGIGYSLRDEVTALDRLLRVAFTICGYELRRVFMDDIILPDDHNLKVAVCNCLLNAIKRIKEILESHS